MSKPRGRRTAVKQKQVRTHVHYQHVVPEGTELSTYMVGLMVQGADYLNEMAPRPSQHVVEVKA